ncbi:hypothetical protein BKA66DRAFT_569275 [Pyrenochaeta sp. MPI-SDFR-AT-0127]|nr:hypothetical protein BKA66DRAFT_569275 [Pyrenochaeta sp. MPI-SDFR-AT-0127]
MKSSVDNDASIPPIEEPRRLKFSQLLTSRIITINVGKSRTFHLHADLLTAESEELLKNLTGSFKEASENAIDIESEDPDLFGFFVEYLYCNRSILSREVEHYSDYVTLARLYAMGERLMAPKFQSYAVWRFAQSLSTNTRMSDESICELLRIACTEITERVREDPMRAQIFWCAGYKINTLQKFGLFRQLLCDIPDVGRQICLSIGQSRPEQPGCPDQSQQQMFAPECEFNP